ncbi:hypothetical protein ACOSP7_012669 [Xanthoceras sorbifolium]
MRYWNQVLLVKIGWRLFQRDESLWSNMIHNKYVKNKNIVDLCNKNFISCSSIWMGIVYGGKLLLEGAIWRVEDERLENDSGGNFTVKSSYNSLFEGKLCDQWNFDIVWKIKVLPKIQCFLWTGFSGDFTCSRCNAGYESLEHLLRSCISSSRIWEDRRYGVAMIRGDPGEWRSWFLANLKNKKMVNGTPICKSIFDPDFKLHPWPYIPIFGAIQNWLVVAGKKENPPHLNWVKLNVDSSRSSFGCIATGGAIRDNNGQWLGRFILNKGIGSALEAKLWGVADGFFFVKKRMMRKRNGKKKTITQPHGQRPRARPARASAQRPQPRALLSRLRWGHFFIFFANEFLLIFLEKYC